MRHVFPTAVIVALLLLAGGITTGTTAQDATPAAAEPLTRTSVRYVLPLTDDGLNPALSVVGEERGTCLHESLASPGRADAWGCITEAGSRLLDPCFESPFALPDEPGELVCMDSPFTTDVIMFTPTEPLPRVKESDKLAPDPLPWALELANGDQCTLATGATVVFAGMRMNYFCPGGSILGEPDRDHPVWAVVYLPTGDFATEFVDVVAVWH